jgi:hypothetical protein
MGYRVLGCIKLDFYALHLMLYTLLLEPNGVAGRLRY